MNAIKFIQKYGVEKAREVVEDAPSNAVYYWQIPRCKHGVYSSQEQNQGRAIVLEHLKRLVASVDLIESYKGIDEARWYVKRWFKLHSACKQVANAKTYITDQLTALQQAIADYEAIGGEHV